MYNTAYAYSYFDTFDLFVIVKCTPKVRHKAFRGTL